MKKFFKILLILLLIAIPIVALILTFDPLQDLTINTSNTKLIYDLGEDFTADGLEVLAHYKTEDNAKPITNYTIDSSAFNKNVVGTYEIKVQTGEYKTCGTYTVDVKDIGTLNITRNNIFFVGQDFKSNSPTVTHIGQLGTKIITDYEVLEFDNNSIGSSTATILYNGIEYSIDVEIVDNLTYFDWVFNQVKNNASNTTISSLYYGSFDYNFTIVKNDNFLYYLDDQDNVIKEMWIDQQGSVITKTTNDNHSAYSQEQYSSFEEACLAKGDIFVPDRYYSFILTESLTSPSIIENVNPLHNYYEVLPSITNGELSITVSKYQLERTYSASATIGVWKFDIQNYTLLSYEEYPNYVSFGNRISSIPAIPTNELPTAEDKGTLTATSNYKYPQMINSNIDIYPNLTYTTKSGTSYTLKQQEYSIDSIDASQIGPQTVTVKYNTFEFDIEIEIVSSEDYISYLLESVLNNASSNNVQNLTLDNNKTVYIYDATQTFYIKNNNMEYWCLSDGTLITRNNDTENVTQTKVADQITAIHSLNLSQIPSTITDVEEIIPHLYATSLDELDIRNVTNTPPENCEITSTDFQYSGYQGTRLYVQFQNTSTDITDRYNIHINTETNTIIYFSTEDSSDLYLTANLFERENLINRAPIVPYTGNLD